MAPVHRMLRAARALPAPTAAARPATLRVRCFSQTAGAGPLRMPYKDDQDRESLKPRAQEYAKSGTDEDAAAQDDAAFNPNKTSPEAARRTAGAQNDGNPLDVSPANKEMAEAGRDKAPEDRAGSTPVAQDKQRASGGGSPKKHGKVV